MRFAHISDPHFGTTTPEKIAVLTKALMNLDLSFVAVSGDITQRTRRAQFREARRFFDDLRPLPVFVVPGNHDLPLYNVVARFLFPYFNFRQTLKRPTSFRQVVDGTLILGLDSTHPSRAVQGDFRSRENRMLHRDLPESELRIAMFHHPLDTPKYVDVKNILKGAEAAVPALAGAKIDLALSGHIHDPMVVTTKDRYPKLSRPFVLSVAGTCLSSRTRANAPNSFHVFDWHAAAQSLRARRFDLSKENSFGCVGESNFHRNGNGWEQLNP